MMLRVAKGLSICVAVTVLVIAGCAPQSMHVGKTGARDIPVAYVRRELPAEQNAYPLWTNAMAQTVLPDDDVLKKAFHAANTLTNNMPEGPAGQLLADWLDARKEAIDLISKGVARGHLQFPETVPKGIIGTLGISGILRLSNLKAIEGRRCAARKDFSSAARELNDAVKMGQMVVSADGGEVAYLVGVGMRSAGLNRLRWLSSQEGVGDDVLREVLGLLPVPDAADPCLAQAYRREASFECVVAVNELRAFAGRSPDTVPIRLNKVFDAEETARLAAEYYARYEANALCVWTKRDANIAMDASRLVETNGLAGNGYFDYCWDFATNVTLRAEDERARRTRWRLLEKAGIRQPNIFGRMLVNSFVSSADTCLMQSFKSRTLMSLTRAFVALRIARKEMGAYPDSLVATGWLRDVPKDFFADKPIRYSREKRTLWSVGSDSLDDGGDARKDIVLRLPE